MILQSTIEEYDVSSCEKEIKDIPNSKCWIVTFTRSGENLTSAKILSSVHTYIANSFNPITLYDGSSAYYNKALYTYFNAFEQKLHALLRIKGELSKDTIEDYMLNKDLKSLTYGELFKILFSSQFTFTKNIKDYTQETSWQFTKAEIIDFIQGLSEISIWDNQIGKDAVPLLRSDFEKVKNYRNDVMHAHSMKTSQYNDARKLIKEINSQLDTEIENLKTCNGTIANHNSENFNATLADAIRWYIAYAAQQAKDWQEQVATIIGIPMLKACAHIINSDEFKALQQSPQRFFQQLFIGENPSIKQNLPPALLELQKSKKATENTHNGQDEI